MRTGIYSANKEKGFSLVEMLISMVIFSIVMGIIYTYLLQTKLDVAEVQEELNTADNAQTAINSLRKDLYRIGIGRDSGQEQPQLLRAGMYEIIFISDLDQEIRNQDKRFGSPNHNLIGMTFNPGDDYYPLAFLYDATIPENRKSHNFDPLVAYGNQNLGAEIVRYSLDMNSDGVINYEDLEDNIDIDADRVHTQNPNDFWLNKEWWGTVKLPGFYRNSYSGSHPVAFNLKGMFYKHDAGIPVASNNRFRYPAGNYPPPIFTYWGHFYNTITANDDPQDENWPGEPIELWGDWGGQRPTFNQPSTPNLITGARDGVLSDAEIQYMYNNPLYCEVNLNYLQASSGRAGERDGQDLNGNGIPGEQQLDDFIRRIGVTIITESDSPNPNRPNLQRSDLRNPANPSYYYYQDYELSVQINPRNLAYSGNPVIQIDQMTPTPPPSTPTPAPPTNTPDPSAPTPTQTNTPIPSPTPGFTPGLYDPFNSDVIIGTETNLIKAVNIDRNGTIAPDLCAEALQLDLYAGSGSIIDMEPANFCDVPGFFDRWNDLVIATDATNGIPNLIYFKHLAYRGIDGIQRVNDIIVGSETQDQISCIEVGNLGYFGLAHEDYDEVVVAYRRPGVPSQTFLEVFFLNIQCGDLVSVGSLLPIEGFVTENSIQDMLISDFDGDGLGELVILWDSPVSAGTSQIRYYPDLNNTATGWLDYQDWFIDWGVDVQCTKLIATQATLGIPVPVEKDLIVVAENGDFRLIPNHRTGVPGDMPFPTAASDFFSPLMMNFDMENITAAAAYNRINHDLDYHPVLALVGQCPSDQYHHIIHYDISDPANIFEMPMDSGPIVPLVGTPAPTPVYPIVNPLDMVYAPTTDMSGNFRNRNLIIPTFFNLNYYYFIALMNPVDYHDTTHIWANCQFEMAGLLGGLTCITSTTNSYSEFISYMPTPTPINSPSPTATP